MKDNEKIAETLDSVAEVLCDTALEIARITRKLHGNVNPWEKCADEDNYGEDVSVLYAIPGKPFELVTEEYAIDDIIINGHEADFRMHPIADGIFAMVPKDVAVYTEGNDALIDGPIYVCSIDMETGNTIELTAVDFVEACMYLTTHAIRMASGSDMIPGFILYEEE